eukprot:Seg399.5 transcript_id=Seg399.5/GoldUCD/mRNA.D3Y31 product="hypothetical protein" protein_id=Seg399.5/GoldUCD/D3Y31
MKSGKMDGEEDYTKLKRTELQKLCKAYKLKATGKNVDLVERLQGHQRKLSEVEEEEPTQEAPVDKTPTLERIEMPPPSTKPDEKTRRARSTRKQAKPKKVNTRKKQKGVKFEEDNPDEMIQGISEEKHKADVVAASDEEQCASNSSQDSTYCLPTVGPDSVFTPGKLVEPNNNIETIVQSPTMLTSSRLLSTESGSEQLKQIAMISPLVKPHLIINRTLELNRDGNQSSHIINSTFTEELNRGGDEQSNLVNSTFAQELDDADNEISHIANSTFEQADDITQTSNDLDSSFDITTDQRVSADLYDGQDSLANTISYERDSDAAFQQRADKQVLAEDSHVVDNTSHWLARHSSVQRDSTVDYNATTDYDEIQRNRTQSLENPANHTDESDSDEMNRNQDEMSEYLNEFYVTANSSVWLHSGNTVRPAKIGTKDYMIDSESPAFANRRETFLMDKTTAGKISNKVHVQNTDRRGTYQIAVPPMCPEDSPKTSRVDEESPESSPDSGGYRKERLTTANCYETDDEKQRQTKEELSVEREIIGRRTRRKDNRKTFVLNKGKISKEVDSRRGTFVIRKSLDSEKSNAEDADDSDLNDNKENPPWDWRREGSTETNSLKQKEKEQTVNFCVCHGAVIDASGWGSLTLRGGLVYINNRENCFDRLMLKPADKELPRGYQDNLICSDCMTKNDKLLNMNGLGNKKERILKKTTSQKLILNNSKSAIPKVLRKQMSESCLPLVKKNNANLLKRKCEENHVECPASPATKRVKGTTVESPGGSPQARRARGEKIELPKHLLAGWKPKKHSVDPLERKEDKAHAEKVERILQSVQPGSEEEMALAMKQRPKISSK